MRFVVVIFLFHLQLFESSASISTEEFLKMRCDLDKSDQIYYFSGMLYSDVPQEKQMPLFGLVGMNIVKCFQDRDGIWYFSSRELMYYTDPNDLNKPLYTWENPWTKETVNVGHVANNPVQGAMGSGSKQMDAEVLSNGMIIAVPLDINLFYPNPLYTDSKFKPYSPQEYYRGGEFFKYFALYDDLKNNQLHGIDSWLSWERYSQWLPWMKMGDRPGGCFCSATGAKVKSFDEIPTFMWDDITSRLPLYLQAPPCILDIADSTSWTYFEQHFDAYLNGDRFPISAPNTTIPCKFDPRTPFQKRVIE